MANWWTKFHQQIPTQTQERREKVKFRSEKIWTEFAESRHPRLLTERIRKKFAQATFFPNALKLRKSERAPLRLRGME